MMFYESGGKAYAVFQIDEQLIPRVGFHIPGKMAGIWLGDIRVISSIGVEGFGKALDVVYKNVGRTLKFESGEIEILIPHSEKSVYFRFKGMGKISFEIDGTRTWLSKPEKYGVFKDRKGFRIGNEILKIDSDGRTEFSDNGFELNVNGLATLCVTFENAKAIQYDLKRSIKEMDLISRIPQGRSNTEGILKSFLYEMYLETHGGAGFMAGLEEYPWWFSIDTSFLVPTLLRIGMEDLVKRALSFIISMSDGIPPHEIVSSGIVNDVYNEVELFSILHSVLEYTLHTGDVSLLEDSKPLIENAKKLLRSGFPKGRGMVELDGGDSWLDVSCWAFAFLRSYSDLEKMGIFEDRNLSNALEFFKREFLNRWYDRKTKLFKDEGVHFTQVLPMYFGLVPEDVGRSVLMKLSKMGMINEFGLKHSLNETSEDGFYGEKSGKVWWLANHLLRESVRRYGVLKASHLENLFEMDLKRFKTPPEIVGGGGCFAQSWSALFGLSF